MKCVRCGTDSKLKDRPNRTCPKCKGKFAFEPQEKDPVTDQLFKNAIDAVSSSGNIRWGVEHLYYEINRRKRRHRFPFYVSVLLLLGGLAIVPLHFPVTFFVGLVPIFFAVRSLTAAPYVAIDAMTFRRMWDRWCQVHGTPDGVILRSPEIDARHRAARSAPEPAARTEFGKREMATAGVTAASASVPSFGKPDGELEADLADYSFDRAVICDRARTADLLIANNFHFENNCAILSIDGYPESVFDTVKAMIKRNPRLHVFTLHDATPEGCRLAAAIAYAPDWFDGRTTVIDLGLRPRHAGALDRKSTRLNSSHRT